MIHLKPVSTVRIYTPTCVGAYFGSVPPEAGFKKCGAYFLKEAKSAPEQVRSPAS
jgi:hypothetical protein